MLLVGLMGLTALRIGAPDALGVDAVSADYMIFHQVGELANEGRAALAYDAEAFKAHQLERTGSDVFMTWTYPPQFNLLTQLMALFPVWLGYLLFSGLSLAFFVWSVLRFSSGRMALMLVLPAIVINLLTGQNGFLTAGMMALFARFALARQSTSAGVTLGLLAYKPHLGLGLGLAALLRGGFRMVAVACLTLAVSLLLVTLVYGPDIWRALQASVEQSNTLLQAGQYKLVRMSTPFALLASLGLTSGAALTLHFACALASLGAVAYAALRRWQLEHVLALGMISGAALSPYAYDYDLCLLAPALALVWPDLTLTPLEKTLLTFATLLATGFGLLTVVFSAPIKQLAFDLPALGGLGLILLLAITLIGLRRTKLA
ncbi:glycosyltransferase family 87 protein [Lentibacter algarum]|uniref:glycosyltransferase family 87 protein n=1 Tax=Lentibacter algarum TaxID=576131 RepID=UPI001C0790A5|nr:glycosyltransferase family 87 protein [Lentibacter algarum]